MDEEFVFIRKTGDEKLAFVVETINTPGKNRCLRHKTLVFSLQFSTFLKL